MTIRERRSICFRQVLCARLLFCLAGLALGHTAVQAQTITLTSPTNGARIDLNQTGDIIEVDWDYTGPGSPVGFSLWVNGANIGFSDLGGCSFGGGTGTCFFHASDTVCSPVLQVKGSFVPGGEKFASPIQVFFYRGNDPASFSCLPSPPQCAGDQAGGSVGGPINVVTGNMHYEAVDIEVPSPLPILIARRYDTQRSYSGPMGVGFRHRYDTRMQCGTDPNGLGQNCKYTDAENNVTYRGKTATGFTSAWYSIANDSFNGSQLTEPHQTKYNYSGTTLSSIQDRNGNTLTFAYDGGGKLMTITDTFGRQVTFGYTGTLVTSITRPDGRQIGYGYTSGRLTSVTYPDGVILSYEYTDAAHPDNLTAVKDKYGHVVEAWTYDSQNRAKTYRREGDVRKLTLDYDTPLAGHTRVTDILTNQTDYTVDSLKKVVTDIVGPCQSCGGAFNEQHFVWDAFQRITQLTDGRGLITDFQWDNSSPIKYRNLTRRIDAKTTPLERTTYFCYDSTYNFVTTAKSKSVGTCSISDSCGVATTNYMIVSNGYDPLTGDLKSRQVKGCEAAVAKTYATTYIYNGKGQLTQVDGPRTDATPDDITMHSYFPNTDVQQYGFLATVTNPLSQGTSYSGYDSMGQPGTVTDANLVQTTLTYDEMERIASSTIVGGIPSENISTSYSYDDHVGHLASVTNARNFVTNYGEDAAHRLTDVTDPLGNVRHTDYDLMSRSVREELRDSGSTVHQFTNFANDAFGRVTHVCFTGSVVDCPSAAVHTNVFYDGDGNLMREEDPLGHATDYGRDQLNRLSTVTQTTGASTLVTTYQYDAQDSLITVTDPKGLQNIYTNSDTGWRLTASTPDAGSMTYTYDAAGNVLTSTDTVPVAIGRTYDSMNRLLTVVYPNSSLNVTYSYDAVDSPPGTYFNVGHRTLMADSSGAAAYHYDRRGLLRSEEKTVGARRYVTAYEYDKTGNLTQVRFPTESPILRQGQADFTYDAADRVSGVIANVNGASTPVADTFAYKPFGPRTSLRFGNTLVDSRTFGTRYQVGTWTSGSLLSYTYAFNDDLNLTGVTDNLNATNNRTFGYDGVHRLTLGAAIGLWGPGTSCSGATYTYDSNGFRTCKGEDGTSTSYSPVAGKNRLNSETTGGTTTAYAYDTHGNTTGVTVTPPGTTRTFQYDQSDRLSAVLDPGPTTVASYVYDGDARRVSATSGTTTTIFLYDQGGRLLTEIVPGNTTIGKDYVYLAASPLARVDWTITETDLSGSPGPLLVNKSSPNVHLDWANAAGSGSHVVRRKQVVNPADKTFNGSTVVAGVTDPTRMYDDPVLNDTNRYDYKVLRKTSNDTLYFYHSDHLGTPIAMTDTLGATKWRAEYRPFGGVQSLTSTIVNSLRLPGQYEAPETGLYYNVNRWFENRSGRYSQTDPVYLAGFSPYSYALNDPIGISDPLGLLPAGFSAEDTCLICTVYGEARGQSTPCQEAVASVILNRVANCRALRRQTSVCSVVSSRGQFRAYNNNNYRSCASCTQPGTVPELPPILTTLTNPFAVGPAADFFANNEPKAIRDIKKGVPQPLDPVSFPNCSTFAFFRVRRAPSGRPQQPGYCK